MAISTGSTITASDINNALSGKANSTHTHSGGDITSAVANATNATNADKLDGYHASAFLQASSYTASDVLAKIKTVDGAGSDLDADKWDGGDKIISTSDASGTYANGSVWFKYV